MTDGSLDTMGGFLLANFGWNRVTQNCQRSHEYRSGKKTGNDLQSENCDGILWKFDEILHYDGLQLQLISTTSIV